MSDGPDRLEFMLRMQRDLQGRINGYDLTEQSTEQRVANVSLNVLALTDELHELLNETSWKPWAKGTYVNRDAAVKELIDAWHFFMNLMLHLDVTPGELLNRYVEKNRVNHQRQDEDYDGVATKCQGCKRELGDVGITFLVGDDGKTQALCNGCQFDVSFMMDAMNPGTVKRLTSS